MQVKYFIENIILSKDNFTISKELSVTDIDINSFSSSYTENNNLSLNLLYSKLLKLNKQVLNLGTSFITPHSSNSSFISQFKYFDIIVRFKNDDFMSNSIELYIEDISMRVNEEINLTLKNYNDLGNGFSLINSSSSFFNKTLLNIYNEYNNYIKESIIVKSESKNIFNDVKMSIDNRANESKYYKLY